MLRGKLGWKNRVRTRWFRVRTRFVDLSLLWHLQTVRLRTSDGCFLNLSFLGYKTNTYFLSCWKYLNTSKCSLTILSLFFFIRKGNFTMAKNYALRIVLAHSPPPTHTHTAFFLILKILLGGAHLSLFHAVGNRVSSYAQGHRATLQQRKDLNQVTTPQQGHECSALWQPLTQ